MPNDLAKSISKHYHLPYFAAVHSHKSKTTRTLNRAIVEEVRRLWRNDLRSALLVMYTRLKRPADWQMGRDSPYLYRPGQRLV